MALHVFDCGLLMLCWTIFCVGMPSDPMLTGQSEKDRQGPTEEAGYTAELTPRHSTVSHLVPQTAACFLEDVFAAMQEASGNDSELSHGGMTLFGICTAAVNLSVLLELAMKAKRKHRDGLEMLHPTEVLLLAFESPVSGGDLHEITFISQSLQPNTQTVCISEGTQYILLTGRASVGQQRWILSVDSKLPDMKKNIKELLGGGNTSKRSGVTPVLLFHREEQSDTSSSQPLHLLCELRRFLNGVLPPQNRPLSSPLKLDSLQALPPVTLGLSSSESLLAELMNSSAPTIFSFTGSMFNTHRGELAMPPGLLEELRKSLEHNLMQIMQVLREKEGSQRSIKRLERLLELCAFPKVDLPSGESQYCAFLLLKALKTVGREMLPQLRATRAEPSGPRKVCGLRSLTVSLERYLVGPDTADIKNCQGQCTVPLVNTKSHAVLVNFHIENGNVQERAPCCVPVAYDSLEVVDLNQHGTFLSVFGDVVAKECGCR
ncbi:muellerian-inhibiting factor isoform X2 [Dunckerocampus dactyliophorus]|uniref:muellerian-inhibiting factor isoform X2 n=1 Tax=Dunckerocampus dactyliophorus TaxID=161453 RepID=UPI002405B9F9|nr:muellerian-inhibiting factor isoform X2 [Dunckerocampus dactyliophorus]